MAFEGPLEDRQLIRERVSAYGDASTRGDMEAWLANFSEDCVWIAKGMETRGKPALREHWVRIWESMEKMIFFAEVGAIQVSGERATARCYTREIVFMKSGSVSEMIGGYDDELVRENGAWLFARREHRLFVVQPMNPLPRA